MRVQNAPKGHPIREKSEQERGKTPTPHIPLYSPLKSATKKFKTTSSKVEQRGAGRAERRKGENENSKKRSELGSDVVKKWGWQGGTGGGTTRARML